MFHSNLKSGEVDDVLRSLIKTADKVIIASGYFGLSQVQKYKNDFINILKKGGEVILIHGLGKFESIPKALEEEFKTIQKEFTKHRKTKNSGIFFATDRRYHGKVYILSNSYCEKALIGSSNFSEQGNIGNLEANVLTSDNKIIYKANHLISQLLKYSQEYQPGILPVRNRKKHTIGKTKDYKIPTGIPIPKPEILKKNN